jgi:hypothetical protein
MSITIYSLIGESKIHFTFSDDTKKIIDFNSFTRADDLSKPLSDFAYFQ